MTGQATLDKPTQEVKSKWEPDYLAVIFTPGRIKKSKDPGSDPELTGINTVERMRVLQHFQYVDDSIPHLPGMAVTMQSFMLHPGTNIGIHRLNPDDTESIEPLTTKIWLKVCENWLNRSYLFYNDPLIPQSEPEEEINKANRQQFRYEAIEVILPIKPMVGDEPRLSYFSDKDALKLVKSTMSEVWLKRYLVGENRAAINNAAEKQIEKILSIRAALMNQN